MRWPVAGGAWPSLNPERRTDDALPELRTFVEAARRQLGLSRGAQATVYPLQTARFTSPNDLPQSTLSTQILMTEQRGVTIIFDAAGTVRHVIPTSQDAS